MTSSAGTVFHVPETHALTTEPSGICLLILPKRCTCGPILYIHENLLKSFVAYYNFFILVYQGVDHCQKFATFMASQTVRVVKITWKLKMKFLWSNLVSLAKGWPGNSYSLTLAKLNVYIFSHNNQICKPVVYNTVTLSIEASPMGLSDSVNCFTIFTQPPHSFKSNKQYGCRFICERWCIRTLTWFPWVSALRSCMNCVSSTLVMDNVPRASNRRSKCSETQ